MKIYVLYKEVDNGKESICVSEDVNKIRKSICEDLDPNDDYPELEIWEDCKKICCTSGIDVLHKVASEINLL